MGGSNRGARGAAPRVQISYEADVDGYRGRRELPFVLGVVANFAGNPDPPLPRLRERKFADVDRSTIDKLMTSARPRLALHVENRLRGDSSKLAVELRFESMEDFEPEAIARQVPPLQKLLELREELSDLLRALHARSAAAAKNPATNS